MPNITQPGTYDCRVKDARLGESQSGKPRLGLYLETDQGQHIWADVWLSRKAFKKNVETLRDTFGFNGDFETIEEQVKGQACSAVVDEDEYKGKIQLKVRWINPIGGRSSGSDSESEPDRAKLTDWAKKVFSAAPAPAQDSGDAPDDDDVPF